jgi:hypothetical protein
MRLLGVLAAAALTVTALGGWVPARCGHCGLAHTHAPGARVGSCCQADPARCAACVRKTTTKKVTSYTYSTRETLKCVPAVHSRTLACLFHKDPDCPACQQPIAVRVLVKKKVVKEVPVEVCEPVGR